jgi:vacuolar-type H+-ATPase subunit E/Vma4
MRQPKYQTSNIKYLGTHMELSEKGKAALINGIETDAAQEVRTILAEAEKQADEKRKYGQKKVADLLAEARQRAREQAEAIERKVLSEVELEVKRRSLKVRDTVINEMVRRVEAKLKTRIGDPGYRGILRDWVVEAVRGLAVDEAQLNASAPERELLEKGLLQEVVDTVRQLSGRTVHLRLADAAPLEAQGVLVTATDGRMAFNNQVKTRMLRKRRTIHMLIHKALFEE